MPGENNLWKFLQDAGIECRRVPLSGSAEDDSGDLAIYDGEVEQLTEVKIRGNGFKSLNNWLAGYRYLFLKADRKEYLCVMRLDEFIRLLKEVKCPGEELLSEVNKS